MMKSIEIEMKSMDSNKTTSAFINQQHKLSELRQRIKHIQTTLRMLKHHIKKRDLKDLKGVVTHCRESGSALLILIRFKILELDELPIELGSMDHTPNDDSFVTASPGNDTVNVDSDGPDGPNLMKVTRWGVGYFAAATIFTLLDVFSYINRRQNKAPGLWITTIILNIIGFLISFTTVLLTLKADGGNYINGRFSGIHRCLRAFIASLFFLTGAIIIWRFSNSQLQDLATSPLHVEPGKDSTPEINTTFSLDDYFNKTKFDKSIITLVSIDDYGKGNYTVRKEQNFDNDTYSETDDYDGNYSPIRKDQNFDNDTYSETDDNDGNYTVRKDQNFDNDTYSETDDNDGNDGNYNQ
ncbi:hypothetical protein DFJ63DRAFT_333976 [Scheffersomyces coipomensis]|uniref:uncharacterized protein n=1 Tax=Scheffersomyces coipomensis TaxID=1788519 RepID=UPI00315DCE5A